MQTTDSYSDPLFQSLPSSELLPRVRPYKEANCGFRMYDHECFSLECFGLLSKIYLCKSSSERQRIIQYLATGLASLCGVLHDLPYICFQEDSLQAQELALALEDQIDALYRKLPHLQINDSRPVLGAFGGSGKSWRNIYREIKGNSLPKGLRNARKFGIIINP